MLKKISNRAKIIFAVVVAVLLAITVYVGVSVKSESNNNETAKFMLSESSELDNQQNVNLGWTGISEKY